MDQSATDFSVMFNPQNQNAANMANWMSQHIAERTDPASKVPGAPPLLGNDAVPHTMSFQSLVGSFSRAYLNPDEAVRDSLNNAHLMEKDVGLLESVECRQRLTALLDWEIKPENEKCPYQVSLAQELQRIIGRIRNFVKYRMWLMKAIWYGRSGIQHKYGYTRVNGAMRMMPTPLHRDHNGWMPVHGDKLVFRYEDSVHETQNAGAYPHQMGIRVGSNLGKEVRLHRDYELEPVSDGMALFLKPYERDTFCVHKHFIEDADFQHSYFAGSIHGVGIRSKIYWEWFLKQEAFAFLMQYLERSAGGIEVWTYPMGDKKALEATQKAAREKMANGRNVIFFPKPMGDDSESYKFDIIEPGAMGLDIMQSIIENYFGGRLKRYILGQELSTEAKATGMGSGVAEAHMDTLSQIVQFDASNLEETMTYELVRYIQQLNFPETMGWHMRFSLKTQDENSADRMNALNTAYYMVAAIAETDVFSDLRLRAPVTGKKTLLSQSQQQSQMQMQAAMQPQIPGMMGDDGSGMPPEDGEDPDGGPEDDDPMGGGEGEEDDMDGDPVEMIKSLMDQYVREALLDRDRYATQLNFQWDEKLHPRVSGPIGPKTHAGEFTSKNTGVFGQAKPKQKTMFGDSRPVPKRNPAKKNPLDQIKKIFEHHKQKQKTLEFDSTPEAQEEKPAHHVHAHKMLDEILKQVDEHKPAGDAKPNPTVEPSPQSAPPRRRMAGQGQDAKAVAAPVAKTPVKTDVRQEQRMSEPTDLPSVETVPHPSPKADAAAQPEPKKEYRRVAATSGLPEDIKDDGDDSWGQDEDTPLTSRQKKLVDDHKEFMKRILNASEAKYGGYDSGDRFSAINKGFMRAAQLFNPNHEKADFQKFAKNQAYQEIKNLNPNRKKINSITKSGGVDEDGYDAMQQVADSSATKNRVLRQEDKDDMDHILATLPEHERWMFKHFTLGEDEDGNEAIQDELTRQFNAKFGHLNRSGKDVTRNAIIARNRVISDKLRQHLDKYSKEYALMKFLIDRYVRMQKAEYLKDRYVNDLKREIELAVAATDTNPSESQKEAGNYKKGKFQWNGLTVVIENPKGSIRKGKSEDGKTWSNTMAGHYGYISRTVGADGDQIDIIMGPEPSSIHVFVVNQIDKDGKFDEHKCILGCEDKNEAKELYLKQYPKGWKCGPIDSMNVDEFKKWMFA